MHNTRCVEQILEFFGGLSDVHLVRCPLDPQYNCGYNLSLEEIDEGEDLSKLLRSSFAETLVIDNCPGFGDAVLNAMTDPGAQEKSCAYYMEGLTIIDCPNFSISALKQLVKTRRFQLQWSYEDDCYTPTPQFRDLRLVGCVPVISSEDIDWFNSCVSQFAYNPTR
jgi:hypothetical protein